MQRIQMGFENDTLEAPVFWYKSIEQSKNPQAILGRQRLYNTLDLVLKCKQLGVPSRAEERPLQRIIEYITLEGSHERVVRQIDRVVSAKVIARSVEVDLSWEIGLPYDRA